MPMETPEGRLVHIAPGTPLTLAQTELSQAELEFQDGRGVPQRRLREANPACSNCEGSGFMDAGVLKVYCNCLYQEGELTNAR